MNKLVLASILVFFSAVAHAANYSYPEFTADLPSGFEAPVAQGNSGAKSWVFAKSNKSSSVVGILQITVYDFGEALPAMSEDETNQAMEQYLMEFLAGVERRRSSFSTGAISNTSIGIRNARSIDWEGLAEGIPMRGRMYVTIVGSAVYMLHVQGSEQQFAALLSELSSTIETMVLNGT